MQELDFKLHKPSQSPRLLHSAYGLTLNNLGLLYQRQSQHTKALELFRKSLEVFELQIGWRPRSVVFHFIDLRLHLREI
jgi:hypothetical protein